MTKDSVAAPVAAPRARWKRRILWSASALLLLVILFGASAALAWLYRTDVAAWAIATYLTGEDVEEVTLDVVAVEPDRLLIRNLRISGDRTTTVDRIALTYTIDRFIAGSVNTIDVSNIRTVGGPIPVEIDKVTGGGTFKAGLVDVDEIVMGVDIIRLRLGPQVFDPSRVEIEFRDGVLGIDSAFASPDGYLTLLGSGPLDDPDTPFRLLASGRLSAALAVAPAAGVAEADGVIRFSLSAQTQDPLFFLEDRDDESVALPEAFVLDGTAGFDLDRLRVLETEIPTAEDDKLRFRIETTLDDDGSAEGTYDVAFEIAKRDVPELGLSRGALGLKGDFGLSGDELVLSIKDGPLATVRDLRLSEGLPVPGDITLQLLGEKNNVTVDFDEKTARHSVESQISWGSGELSLTSQGHISDPDDPTVFTLRGAFDATPLLSLSPAIAAESGNANVFLAGRISQPLLLFGEPTEPGQDRPGDVRLDGALKFETVGLAVPGADPSPDAKDSIEIVIKGFNGNEGRQGGRLVANGTLDKRRIAGTSIEQSKLNLDGRLSFGPRGYQFVPGFESGLTIASLRTDDGIVVPDGLNVQLTGDDNLISIPSDFSALFHDLTIAHLQIDGYRQPKEGQRQPFNATIPKITSRRTETEKLSIFVTGASFNLTAEKLSGRGINAALEETTEGYDLGLETGEIRHEARPPLTTPLTLSAKGKIKDDLLDARLNVRQRYTPLKVLGTLKHNIVSQAGRLNFQVPRVAFGSKGSTLDDIFPPATSWFTSSEGAASATGHILWDREILSGQMAVKLDSIDLATADASITDLTGTLNFIELIPLSMPPRQRLVGRVASGELGPWPMQVEFQLREDGKVDVQDLDVEMAGGTVRTRALVDPETLGATDGSVRLRSVDLRQLLDMIGVEGLNGTGRITGTVPISMVDGQVSIDDGQLRTLLPRETADDVVKFWGGRA
ncbi:MAG: YdbH domain-containing protein [Pseudomonadota bacterium]